MAAELALIEQLSVDPSLFALAPGVVLSLGDLVRTHCKTSAEEHSPSINYATLQLRENGRCDLVTDKLYSFASLHELASQWAQSVGGPWVFRVDAECESHEDSQLYLKWMMAEHLSEVLATGLVRRAWIERESDEKLSMHYVFRTHEDYDTYLRDHAPALRDRGRERTPVAVIYRRSISRIVIFL